MTAIACSYYRRRKIRCSGFEQTDDGRCSNCIRFNQDCTFIPVSTQTRAFVPAHTIWRGIRQPPPMHGAYDQPLPPGAPGEAYGQPPPGQPRSQYLHSHTDQPGLYQARYGPPASLESEISSSKSFPVKSPSSARLSGEEIPGLERDIRDHEANHPTKLMKRPNDAKKQANASQRDRMRRVESPSFRLNTPAQTTESDIGDSSKNLGVLPTSGWFATSILDLKCQDEVC